MSTTFYDQLGVIPAALIALMSVFILRGQDAEKAVRRFLLFLFSVGILVLSVLFLTMRFITQPYDQPFFQLSRLLAPSILGVMALVVLNIKELIAHGSTDANPGHPTKPADDRFVRPILEYPVGS